MAAALAPTASVLQFDPRKSLPGRGKPKNPTVKRCYSLFELACEEIGKTRSLNCLKDTHARGEDAESLLDAIATTIVARLASPLPDVHLPALKLLFDVLTLFDLATREDLSDDWFLMDKYQRRFAYALTARVGWLLPAGVASVVSSRAGTSAKSAIFNMETTFLNCVSRILQVVGDPFARALAEAARIEDPGGRLVRDVGLALPLMKAASSNSSFISEMVCGDPRFSAALESYRLQAFSLVEAALESESGKQFADQAEERVPFLPDMFFLWLSDKSEPIRDVSFSCSCLLLNHLGEEWARSVMSLPDSMPMLLRAATDERADVRHFALGMMERMLSLLGPFFASKLDEAGAFDSLLGVYLSGDTRSSKVERRIEKVLYASESDPVVLQKLASKISTTPIINRLVSAHSPCAVSILNSVVMGDQSGDLARQLIVEGAISRCVDALTWKEKWVKNESSVAGWPDPPGHRLVREGRTQLGVQADALLNTLLTFEPKQKAFLLFTQRDGVSVPSFNPNETHAYSSLKAGFAAYKDVVGKLEDAFHQYKPGKSPPCYTALVAAAADLEIEGAAQEVLAQLGNHLEQYKLLVEKKGPKRTASPSELLDYDRRVKRLCGAGLFLTMPGPGQANNFGKLWAPPMLPPPPALLMPPAAPAMLPPPAGPSSAPLALMPPATPKATDDQIRDYLRQHIRPRSDCDKCGVARGADASVRLDFGTEAKNQCPSRKRACCLADHAISLADDGVPLLDRFESENNVTVGDGGSSGRTIKRQKIQEFMRSEHGVETLGKPPHYKVTMYNAPRLGTNLSLENGAVKLDFSFTYTPAVVGGTKGNYMGFEVV